MFSFTSLGVKLDKDLASAKQGVYTFRAQGVVYHDLPCLLLKYFQLYFVETEREVENRINIFRNSSLSECTVNKLISVLEVNPYAKGFRRLKDYPSMDEGCKIRPVRNNVNIPFECDIVIYAHSGDRHRIKHSFGCYDPLQYLLLFPKGDVSWHQNILKLAANEHYRQKQ
ncbi:Phosphatidylinositol 3,5-trisphosphate 5-phosphatase 2, partial [Striga asiatica]